jgi:hypothetical protein
MREPTTPRRRLLAAIDVALDRALSPQGDTETTRGACMAATDVAFEVQEALSLPGWLPTLLNTIEDRDDHVDVALLLEHAREHVCTPLQVLKGGDDA